MKLKSCFIAALITSMMLPLIPLQDCAAAQSVKAKPAVDYCQAFEFVEKQLEKMSAIVGPSYPDNTVNGRWHTTGPDGWTAGFMPGMMWKVYGRTRDPRWLERARRWTAPIAAFRHDQRDLDFGLLFMPTFAEGYRLTGDPFYRYVLLDAAAAFAKRYVPEGKYLRSWGRVDDPKEKGYIIIDFMMNMNIMFWAAREEKNPRYFEMARNTALVTMRTAVRDDGSSAQVIKLDWRTGEKLSVKHKQAYSDSSCWSRGQAWGIYGFTEIYEDTKDRRFLKTAQKMADYYIANVPSDYVPYWDFLAPNIPDEPRDSSSAAIAASGIWELSKAVTEPSLKKHYRQMAINIVDSLTRNYRATGEAAANGRILLHATLHRPEGIGVDESMIVGDYYYLEALLKIIEDQSNVSFANRR
ncbi:MAG: glycoside hydrolase family 88 protein [Terriglobia bacterium]